MIRPLILVALLAMPVALPVALPVAVGAQTRSADATPPQRIRSVTLKSGQKCPPSTDTEIVVCSTNEQPYRIPKELRDEGPVAAKNQSWVNRTATMDNVSRTAAGLPDTCSAVGTGGQSGCALVANRAYAAERRAQRDAAAQTP